MSLVLDTGTLNCNPQRQVILIMNDVERCRQGIVGFFACFQADLVHRA